jgi:hypothetical protein
LCSAYLGYNKDGVDIAEGENLYENVLTEVGDGSHHASAPVINLIADSVENRA